MTQQEKLIRMGDTIVYTDAGTPRKAQVRGWRDMNGGRFVLVGNDRPIPLDSILARRRPGAAGDVVRFDR